MYFVIPNLTCIHVLLHDEICKKHLSRMNKHTQANKQYDSIIYSRFIPCIGFHYILFYYFTDTTKCVTNAEDFLTLCLHKAVLQNVLVGLSNVRGDHWERNNR